MVAADWRYIGARIRGPVHAGMIEKKKARRTCAHVRGAHSGFLYSRTNMSLSHAWRA